MVIQFKRASMELKEGDISSFSNNRLITPKKRDVLKVPTPPLLQITDEDGDEDGEGSVSAHEEIEDLEFNDVIIPRKSLLQLSNKAPSFLLRDKNMLDASNPKNFAVVEESEMKSSDSEFISDATSDLL